MDESMVSNASVRITHEQRREQRRMRAEAMAEFYRAGETLKEIGARYNLTRERVRQLLSEIGITKNDGGNALRVRVMRTHRQREKDKRFHSKYGMSRQQYDAIRALPGRPVTRFKSQRSAANWRGIEWRLTFAEWWSIWEASGKWGERGVGNGYCMSRPGDVGPYAIGNVAIIRGSDNNREFINRYWSEIRSGKRERPEYMVSGRRLGNPNPRKWPFWEMELGQTISVETPKATSLARNVYGIAKKQGWKFRASQTGDVVTVTRVA